MATVTAIASTIALHLFSRSLLYDLDTDSPQQFIQENLTTIENPEFTEHTVFGVCEENIEEHQKKEEKIHFKK